MGIGAFTCGKKGGQEEKVQKVEKRTEGEKGKKQEKMLLKDKMGTIDPTTGSIRFSFIHCLFDIHTFDAGIAHGKVLLHHTSYTV